LKPYNDPTSLVADGRPGQLYWLNFPQGTLQPGLGRLLLLSTLNIPPSDPRASMQLSRIKNGFNYLNDHLSKPENTWLAGEEFTAADVMCVFSLTTMRKFVEFDLSGYEGILGYLQRVSGREGYQRAMKRGDPEMDLAEQMTGSGPGLFPPIRGMLESIRRKAEEEGKGKI
jgi:glutathione S-transferase